MARLNDVPIGSETIESLKRRFVRQNREIARANSIQSLRIRNLESETARLLAENCDLREEITSLQAKLEKHETSKLLDDDILDFKQQIEAKLKEMNDLVNDLGRIPNRRNSLTKDNQSPNEARQAAAELFRQKKLDREGLSNDYASLPVIQEDLGYAELTDTIPAEPENSRLACAEDIADAEAIAAFSSNVQSQVNNVNDSNENAPADARVQSGDDARSTLGSTEESNTAASVSDCKQDEQPQSIGVLHDESSSYLTSTNLLTASQPVSENSTIAATDENDDFQFTRTGVSADGIKQKNKPRKSRASTGRKSNILKPKSTNSRIQPPSNGDMAGFKIIDPAKEVAAVNKPTSVVQDVSPEPKPVAIPLPAERATDQILECNISGIDNDLAERDTTQPSEMEACHTPPPQMSTSASVLAPTSRPSRRSRPAVSYAEPNLRAKMRRPTKELVGAVEGERAMRRASTNVVEVPADSCILTSDNHIARERKSAGAIQLERASTDASLKRTECDLVPPPVNARVSKKRKTSGSNGKEALNLPAVDDECQLVSEVVNSVSGIMDHGNQSELESGVKTAAEVPLDNATIAVDEHQKEDQEMPIPLSKISEPKKSARRSTRASERVVMETRGPDLAGEGETLAGDTTVTTCKNVTKAKPERRVGTRRRSMLV